MTLKPTDMLEIQTAIDAYERKFPRRPAPSAEVALAWRLGKKEWARRQAAQQEAQPSVPGVGSSVDESPWITNALMVGWWGAVAVMVASVFFFGAIVGGFK
ncbi:MAG: hypothetical protein WCD57_20685 [Acidobacteriaceae bacterium]